MFLNVMPILIVLIPLNVVVIIIGFWWFGKLYGKRFNEITVILTEALNRQRAELGAFKGMFMKEIVTHDRVFDELVNLDALDESESETNGSKANNPKRAD